MSLINQALKKAQHDRSGQPDARSSAESGGPAYTPPSVRPRTGLFLILTGTGLILAVAAAVGFFFVLNKNNAPASSTIAETPVPEPAPAITAAMPAPAKVAPSAPIEAVEPAALLSQLPVAKAPPAMTEPAPSSEPAQSIATAQTARTVPDPEAEAAARAAAAISTSAPGSTGAAPDERIIQWLAAAQVMGARISDTGGRVLLNNEAYAVGEMVSYTLGLRVVAVESGRVLFEDERGVRYVKRF